MNSENRVVDSVMRDCGIPVWGTAELKLLTLIPCSASKRLPTGARTVIVALFPYYAGVLEGANLSRYAVSRDYHLTVTELLARAAGMLAERFPGREFVPFCDASPIPEAEAARLAGLGVRGRNGLLIHPVYGSYVFIGELVTDLPLEPCEEPGGSCFGCNACERACPAGALAGGRVDKTVCVSKLTQKKGGLTEREEELIRKGGLIWGCDVCQNVCPMNRHPPETPLAQFRSDLKPRLSGEELESPDFESRNRDRAFLWKGGGILKRNLRIISGAPKDTNTNS